MLLVYNYVLLKMSTWYSKHVEGSNNILRINNIQCITLVILYGQFMMHGQRNIKLYIDLFWNIGLFRDMSWNPEDIIFIEKISLHSRRIPLHLHTHNHNKKKLVHCLHLMSPATFVTLFYHVKVNFYPLYQGHSSSKSAGNHYVPAVFSAFLQIFSTFQRKSVQALVSFSYVK